MRTLTLLKTSLATGVLLTSGVAAGTAAVAAPTPGADSVSALCHATAVYGNTPIYSSNSTSSTVVGHLTKGVKTASSCTVVNGSTYSACGYFYFGWVYITSKGYVKSMCVSLSIQA